MGRVGSCYDNAVAESFFATLKTEIGSRVWPTRAAARAAVQQDDLFLASGIEHLRAVLTTDDTPTPHAGQDATRLLAPARSLFRLAEDNRPLYRALIGRRGSDLVVRQARSMLTQVLTEHLRAQFEVSDDTQLEMTVAFLVNGLLGLLVWRLDSNTPYSADEMYEHFERLATPGIQQLSDPSHQPQSRPSPPKSPASPRTIRRV